MYLADKNTFATRDADRKRAVRGGGMVFELPHEVRAVGDAHDSRLHVVLGAQSLVVDRAYVWGWGSGGHG
jgi:hypothetical protein